MCIVLLRLYIRRAVPTVTLPARRSDGQSAATTPARPAKSKRRELATLINEFAAVRVSLDTAGHDPRLLIQDVETGDEILLSPIELASLCLASPDDRINWLRVGQYRDERSH